ncbi:MAG TPA: hypothetical protein PKA61_14985, partial [Nitrospira sp.]|nr:hypothetical protein [Nitrospira sp.]
MSIQRSVTRFVAQSNDIFHQLRSEGEILSDVDLVTLREQLYILDTEADHLQNLKQPRSELSRSMPVGRGPRART